MINRYNLTTKFTNLRHIELSSHRELILEGKSKNLWRKFKQYIYQQAECIQLEPVQATKIHLVDR